VSKRVFEGVNSGDPALSLIVDDTDAGLRIIHQGTSGNAIEVLKPDGTVLWMVDRSGFSAPEEILRKAQSIIAETLPRQTLTTTNQFASGNGRGAACAIRKGSVINNLTVQIATPGSGITHFWLMIYDKNLNLVAQTADTPTAAQSAGNQTIPLTASYVVPSTDAYYLAMLCVGTTPPAVASATPPGSNPFTDLGAPIGTGIRSEINQSGLSSPPNPFVSGGSGFSPWLAAS
jgi:hypothetical protein